MMTTNIENKGNLVIMGLSGSFDIAEVSLFESRFKTILADHPKGIALKMNDLTYIDSSGIGSLIRCMNYAMRVNSNFICFDLNETIRNVFELTQLNKFIEVLTREDLEVRY